MLGLNGVDKSTQKSNYFPLSVAEPTRKYPNTHTVLFYTTAPMTNYSAAERLSVIWNQNQQVVLQIDKEEYKYVYQFHSFRKRPNQRL